MLYCWVRMALLDASNFPRFSSSRPNPLTTAIPWMLSARYWTILSTSVRFSAYSGWILREKRVDRIRSTGEVARQAIARPGLR